MEVSRVRALRGPNLWSHHTSVEAIVSCTPEEESIGNLPGFEARLRALFPQIWPAAADRPRRHHPAGPSAGSGRAGPAGAGRLPGHLQPHHRHRRTGIYQVVVEYSEEDVGRLAMNWPSS
jgi:cyanophycin synthetase